MRKVIAKIDLTHIRHNAEAFIRLTGKPICAVVKANAYGHGAEEVVYALSNVVDCFAVSLLDEAKAIRVSACGKDILILSPPCFERDVIESAKDGFILTVGDISTAKMLVETAKKYRFSLRVHLKVNTGMNRYGMDNYTLGKVCKLLATTPFVFVEGIYSHMYEYARDSAEKQRERFQRACNIAKRYFPNCVCHLGATYGALLGEEFYFDMLRIGIGLYGYLPDGAKDLDKARIDRLALRKAMSVWAEVSAVRKCQNGGLGYGKERAVRGEKVAVVRFGYADGFLRAKENGVYGYERNANNLCMDACLQRRTGRKGAWLPVMLDAGATAKITKTISYEVLCSATRRAKMVYEDATFCGDRQSKRGGAKKRTTKTNESAPCEQ